MNPASVVDRLVTELDAAGINLSVDDRTEQLVCRGQLSRITTTQDTLIRRHVAEVKAVVKARQASWRAAAERRIAAVLDATRVACADLPFESTIDQEQQSRTLAVVEAALAMQNSAVLDQALEDLSYV